VLLVEPPHVAAHVVSHDAHERHDGLGEARDLRLVREAEVAHDLGGPHAVHEVDAVAEERLVTQAGTDDLGKRYVGRTHLREVEDGMPRGRLADVHEQELVA